MQLATKYKAEPNRRGCIMHFVWKQLIGYAIYMAICITACTELRGAEYLLHKACEEGDVGAVKQLLRNGSDPNEVIAKEGITPLHCATKVPIAEMLISYGAIINARDVYGRTPLHIAAFAGDSNVVLCLIRNGANVHSRTDKGQSVLINAVLGGSINALNELCNFSYDGNDIVDALFVAIMEKRQDMAATINRRMDSDFASAWKTGKTGEGNIIKIAADWPMYRAIWQSDTNRCFVSIRVSLVQTKPIHQVYLLNKDYSILRQGYYVVKREFDVPVCTTNAVNEHEIKEFRGYRQGDSLIMKLKGEDFKQYDVRIVWNASE